MKSLKRINPRGDLAGEEWWSRKWGDPSGERASRVARSHKHQGAGTLQCAECGGAVKVLVNPKRNPHSSKLGRAVSMKDHDLCRRCWRRAIARCERGVVLAFPASRAADRNTVFPAKPRRELPQTGT